MMKLMGALSLVASAPVVLAAQAPAPAPQPAQPNARSAPARAERVEHRTVVRRAGAPGRLAARVGMAVARRAMMPNAASMFLAHTGELQLTDAQVTRLAAIARRAESREKAMRTRMDSVVTAMPSTDSSDGQDGGAAMVMMRMAVPSDAERRAMHEDNKEAFSVVTADQLATAWELMMRMHHR